MMVCEDCKFAIWDLTDSGRRSPNGGGFCCWKKKVSRPACVGETSLILRGSFITRKKGQEWPDGACPTFQRRSPK